MLLYEIDKKIEEAIESLIDAETGEILDVDTFANLQIEHDKAVDGLACYVKNLNAESDAIKAEIDALTQRRKVVNNKIDSYKNQLKTSLNGEKFKSSRVSISYRNTEYIEVSDILKLPQIYLKKPTPEANKTAIKNAIKLGEEVQGAFINTRQLLIIK